MDLDKVVLVDDTPDEFVLKDEHGEFRVAKRMLRGETHQQIIQHFARGGAVTGTVPTFMVDIDGDGIPDPLTGAMGQMDAMAAPPPGPQMAPAHQPGAVLPGAQQGMESLPPPPVLPQQPQVESAIGAQPPPPLAPMQAGPMSQPTAPGGPQMLPSHEPNMGDEQVVEQLMAAQQPPAAAPPPPPQMPQMPQAPRQAVNTPGINGDAEIDDIYAQQSAAVQEQANLQDRLAQDQLQTREWVQGEMMRVQQERKAAYDENMRRGDQLFTMYMNKQIEPNRIWKNASTGQKIAAAFAIGLGGLGQGMQQKGGPNPVMAQIERAIDRDVEAQKADMAKGQFALNYYLRRGEDVNNAAALAKADLLDLAAAQLQTNAARYTGPMAQQAAALQVQTLRENARLQREQSEVRKLDMQMKQTQMRGQEMDMVVKQAALLQMQEQERAAREMQERAQAGGPVNPEMMDPKDRERFVDLPGGKTAMARHKEDAVEIKERVTALNEVRSVLNEMRALRARTGMETPGPGLSKINPDKAAGEALKQRLFAPLRLATVGPGTVTEQDMKKIDARSPVPGAIMSDEVWNARIDALEQEAIDKVIAKINASTNVKLQPFKIPKTNLKTFKRNGQ